MLVIKDLLQIVGGLMSNKKTNIARNDTGISCETNLASTMEIIADKARYDAAVKELLSDKQVLSRILKFSLAEFENMDIEDIMECLDSPIISGVRVEPGHTNNKIMKSLDEDNVLGEGKIFYDIRFNAYLKLCKDNENITKIIKFIMNVEAQKSTKKTKLGYELDNRIVFYMSRMISAQKEVEFEKSNYDDIKPIRSIWVCMDGDTDEDSINRICLKQENIYGKELELNNLDKFVGVVITLRESENVEESKNVLIAMLEELLRNEDIETKKQKLEGYGFKMSESMERSVNSMCNLSDLVYERGTQHGIKQVVLNMLKAKMPVDMIIAMTGISKETLNELVNENQEVL